MISPFILSQFPLNLRIKNKKIHKKVVFYVSKQEKKRSFYFFKSFF